MLVELFAYLGDRLAYWQDAVAVEAYLGTARRRTSVRRHARLLGYRVHDGCSARVLLALSTDTALTLPAGAAVCDLPPGGDLRAGRGPRARRRGGRDLYRHRAATGAQRRPAARLGRPGPLPASRRDQRLPRRADRRRTRPGRRGPAGAGRLPWRAARPATLGDPARRFAVRLDRDPVVHVDALAPGTDVLEVRWHAEDALVRPLTVTEPGADGGGAVRAVALANVVVADHGAGVDWELLDPPQPEDSGSLSAAAGARPGWRSPSPSTRAPRPGARLPGSPSPIRGRRSPSSPSTTASGSGSRVPT